jgi:hypothetical protein
MIFFYGDYGGLTLAWTIYKTTTSTVTGRALQIGRRRREGNTGGQGGSKWLHQESKLSDEAGLEQRCAQRRRSSMHLRIATWIGSSFELKTMALGRFQMFQAMAARMVESSARKARGSSMSSAEELGSWLSWRKKFQTWAYGGRRPEGGQ